MSDLMNSLYGPLSGKYCMYFYIMSIVMFLTFVFLLGHLLMNMIRGKGGDKTNMMLKFNLLVSSFIGYFTNRLLYSICLGSLH